MSVDERRKRIEARLAGMDESAEASKTADLQGLIHELRMHMTELEMQNEGLHRAEHELIESRDRFSDFFDFAPVGYATINDKGMITQANLILAGMLGLERNRLIGQRFSQFIVPQDCDAWYLLTVTLFRLNSRQQTELALNCEDGSICYAQLHCLSVCTEESKTIRITLVDISERRRIERENRRYEEQCRSLFENMVDIYYKTDMDGRIEVVSPSCLAQTGYTQAELLGRRVMEFYIDPAQRDQLLSALLRKGKVNDFELMLAHKNGTPRIASASCTLLCDEAGKPVAIEGILRNITVRKQVEEQLRLSEARYRVLFEQTSDYVLVMEPRTDAVPVIVDANQAAFEKHGYAADDLIGKPITFIDTNISPEAVAERVRLLQSGDPVYFETKHTCSDGSTFWADAVARYVSIGDSSMIYSVERDATRRKQAEADQARLLQENRALMRQLMQVQEDERRTLARDLHDELGQLLTGIQTRGEYITMHAIDSEVRIMGEEIVRSTSASFNASHASLLRLRPATLDTLGLTAALTELTGERQKQAGIVCSLRIDGDIDALDDMRAIAIYRLVQEGLTNAFRHGKADCVNVIIRALPAHAGRDGQLQVEISDNGKGVHAEADRTPTGMGVIGMRERVHALGGTFMLTHVPEDGVRIKAMLPLDHSEDSGG
ncbi:PAS domain S-box protein [Mariprofundus ferrooxydans]|uniref:PAS domain S-box protein n=1 Tax=Mariprofundus ferrooxydans TaxID=314344 RepID=UPI001F1575BF|nr:PAS domain S-box protein [Mariprofundus ferrooxydans]